jgi:hypothetical protein
MTAAQYTASVRATAAVLQRLGRDASHARGHRETSTENKIDPSFVNLDTMPADVAIVPPAVLRAIGAREATPLEPAGGRQSG